MLLRQIARIYQSSTLLFAVACYYYSARETGSALYLFCLHLNARGYFCCYILLLCIWSTLMKTFHLVVCSVDSTTNTWATLSASQSVTLNQYGRNRSAKCWTKRRRASTVGEDWPFREVRDQVSSWVMNSFTSAHMFCLSNCWLKCQSFKLLIWF